MSEEWKDERAEAAMREGTEKIMKAAQEKAKLESELKNKIEESVDEIVTEDEVDSEVDSFEVCIGVGMNQLFPEYITITPENID